MLHAVRRDARVPPPSFMFTSGLSLRRHLLMIFGHKSLALFIDLFHCCAHTPIALEHYIPSTVMIWLTAGKEVSVNAADLHQLSPRR